MKTILAIITAILFLGSNITFAEQTSVTMLAKNSQWGTQQFISKDKMTATGHVAKNNKKSDSDNGGCGMA